MSKRLAAPAWKSGLSLPSDFSALVEDIKVRIRTAQVRAVLAANRELVLLYWGIGRDILKRQGSEGWGAKVIDRLGEELRRAFPGMKGLSPRNLKYMRSFGEAYPEEAFVQQVAAQIPWFHNCVILDSIKDPPTREWYIRSTVEHGWSRNVLTMQIDSHLHERKGKAITNFERTLPKPQSDLAREMLKDPYQLDFLQLREDVEERILEDHLVTHITKFLLELGQGFAFVGRQIRLEVDGREFYVDLLFYHLRLRCFVVIDLKVEEFQPEHAGKMDFYLSAVDDQLRHPDDQPTIGLILCRQKSRVIVEYTLRRSTSPLGVSSYELTRALPASLKSALPTVEEIEAELAEVEPSPREKKATRNDSKKRRTQSKRKQPRSGEQA
jgi:predicted nuclease of restriction endonuclease-like (RecB) superfamily